ncbi:SymE family type I addiction module toxin [Pantoea ananatis]|uniref:SymE family type I addiction module toxin n=1 Tax=Pantoea ananas TaxID=553 RepID=UPI00235E4467|nr:SymE family type I addiction module toxin [Pantoea ananatis]MDI6539649.1 SymE family type I addiction module toxin [Pantoea ananatis]
MTAFDCISGHTEPKEPNYTQRYATVGYVTRTPDYRRIPAITLKGCWLREAGFPIGVQLDVKVTWGRIIISFKPRDVINGTRVRTIEELASLPVHMRKRLMKEIGLTEW